MRVFANKNAKGDKNMRFGIRRFASALLSVCLTVNLAAVSAFAAGQRQTAMWYDEAVEYVRNSGIMVGTSDSEFSPEQLVTRAQVVTTLYRLSGEKTEGDICGFRDAVKGEWYYDAVVWAEKNNVAKGFDDGTFRPEQKITRSELAAFLHRSAGKLGFRGAGAVGVATADALSIPFWAVQDFEWAYGNGFVNGDDQNRINPLSNATRAELAVMLMRYARAIQAEKAEEAKKVVQTNADDDSTNADDDSSATYSVRFETNGGSKVKTQFVDYGAKAAEPGEPTKTGEIFTGWYTAPDCKTEFSFENPITDNVVLYAGWREMFQLMAEATDDILVASEDEYFADEDDSDGDGLLNGDERTIGTDIQTPDTDMDGLTDSEEVNTYHTDPLKFDTDRDGLSDGVEIQMGLDPLKEKTDDETPDGEKKFSKTATVGAVTLAISGNANIADVYCSAAYDVNMSNVPGVVSELYEFYLPNGNTFDSATVTFAYDDATVAKEGCDESDLHVYQLLNDGSFEDYGGIVDKESNTITAELQHFSKYIVANSKRLHAKMQTDVFIVLDDSGSMFSQEDVNDVMGPGYTALAYDPDFKRVDMAKTLISMTNSDVHFGVGKFARQFTNIASGFGSSKTDLYEKLDGIKTNKEDRNFNGTYIASSIISALKNFDESTVNDRKYIILLTDGETTEGFFDNNENDAIRCAIEANVSIITIGLGDAVDVSYLSKISEKTGGIYVHAKDADALDKIYNILMAAINFGFADLDGDGMNDSVLVADSGFNVKRDGWGIKNYIFNRDGSQSEGQCFGMASVAQLRYRNMLPPKGDAIPMHKGTGSLSIYNIQVDGEAYDISDVKSFTDKPLYEYDLFDGWSKNANSMTSALVRSTEDETRMVFSEKMKEMADKYTIIEKGSFESDFTGDDGKHVSSYDWYRYNADVDRAALSTEEKDALEVLIMVNNFYSRQGMGIEKWFDTYDFTIGHMLQREDRMEAFNRFINDLNSGIVPILCAEGHAINAIRLYRTIDNPLEYKIICYDNNRPGEERLLTIRFYKPHGYEALSIQNWTNTYESRIYDTSNIFQTGKKDKAIIVDLYVLERPWAN